VAKIFVNGRFRSTLDQPLDSKVISVKFDLAAASLLRAMGELKADFIRAAVAEKLAQLAKRESAEKNQCK